MIPTTKLDSTRFFFVQEGLVIAVLGAIVFTIWNTFPYVAMMGFVVPLVGGAYWLKTWEHTSAAKDCKDSIGE